MLLAGKWSIYQVELSDADSFPYFPRPEEDEWKKEILQIMMEERDQNSLDISDQEFMNHLCTD